MKNKMHTHLIHRAATQEDLQSIISLLSEDDLGQSREKNMRPMPQAYIDAFDAIDLDTNHYLMVVFDENTIVGTCHCTLVPCLTFQGARRLQLEAIRLHSHHRGQGIGHWMINAALSWGHKKGAKIAQLTTNNARHQAKNFYENLGFQATHTGFKMQLK